MRRGNPEQTLYVVAYDISDDRRRTRVHKTLSGIGRWTQYSLFECYLSEKELVALRGRLRKVLHSKPDLQLNTRTCKVALRGRLRKVLHAEQDSVRFYPLCGTCVRKVETVGSSPPCEDKLFVV